MPYEIERKFLVDPNHPEVRAIMAQPGHRITQGYLLSEQRGVLRVRLMDDQAYLTYKGASVGLARPEFEYPIPLDHAHDMLAQCSSVLRKTRWKLPLTPTLTAELDWFADFNLALVEVELPTIDTPLAPPAWFGTEVSTDPRYFNNALAANRAPPHAS